MRKRWQLCPEINNEMEKEEDDKEMAVIAASATMQRKRSGKKCGNLQGRLQKWER